MTDTNERFMILAESLSRLARIVEENPMTGGFAQMEMSGIRMDIENLVRGIEEERANAAKVEE